MRPDVEIQDSYNLPYVFKTFKSHRLRNDENEKWCETQMKEVRKAAQIVKQYEQTLRKETSRQTVDRKYAVGSGVGGWGAGVAGVSE